MTGWAFVGPKWIRPGHSSLSFQQELIVGRSSIFGLTSINQIVLLRINTCIMNLKKHTL